MYENVVAGIPFEARKMGFPLWLVELIGLRDVVLSWRKDKAGPDPIGKASQVFQLESLSAVFTAEESREINGLFHVPQGKTHMRVHFSSEGVPVMGICS